MRVLVVVPTYQEAENIGSILRSTRTEVPEAHVLVIDDSSPDGTARMAKAVATELGHVDVLVRASKQGLGTAYRTGFAWGIEHEFEVLVEMDADSSHDPRDIHRLLTAVEAGADLAIGSRYVPGGSIPDWRVHRRLLSQWGNRYASFALGLGIGDATSGFRAYRTSVVQAIALASVRADGYAFQIEMAYRVAQANGKIVEVPISFSDRTLGHSKMSWRIVIEALLLVTWWGFLAVCGRKGRRGTGSVPAPGGVGTS
ncbi:MAG TPA: polyprenol monophosphomannose synthase [Acidimicrobiales bacterium]|jgi:dolichol-phosphate mannosyltransferase|nr:polyprenol monophosphomannose synthase [Acidimicrobiales bacterium]